MPSTEPKYDFLEPPKREGEIGRLGPYRVNRLLGQGGMGQVFQAVDSRLKRNVALKVMTSRYARDPNGRRRFLEEARSMAAIHHENVVLVFEVGEQNNTPFMAMELLKGKSLYQHRQEDRMFSDEEVIELGKQVSRGLAAAHDCGIVHRDIKPGNIWIEEPSGRVKILDFGLALAGQGTDRFSGRGSVVGSPGYLAPEQARDDPVDDRTDLYSLEVVMYELCVSQLPQVATTMPGQLLAILAHEPTPIRELDSDVKTALADVIHCALSKEPRDRPDSAAHLEAMLEYAAEAEDEPVSEKLVAEEPAVGGLAMPVVAVAPKMGEAKNTKTKPVITTKPAVSKKAGKIASGKTASRATASSPQSETTQGESRKKSKLSLVVTLLSVLIAIPVVGYLMSRSNVQSNTPLPETVVSGRTKVFKVLAKTLKPFQFGAIKVGAAKVKLGNAMQVKVVIKNTATDGATDPRTINSRAKNIAALAMFAKQGETEKLVQHRKMRPQDMPFAGSEKEFSMSFLSAGLSRGTCDVLFRLQSPDGQTVSQVSKKITIQ